MAINEFFEALFPALTGSLIEFRFIAGPAAARSFYFSCVDDAVLAAVEAQTLPSITDAYFGVCPRSERSGAKTSIRVVNALWADVDAKDFAGGKGDALAALHGFTPQPSFIVDSGRGFHTYWVLESPVRIESTEDIERVEGVLKAIATALGGDKRSAELARVLRIPGTKNVKDHTAPLSVMIIESNPDRRSPLSAFPAPPLEAVGKPRNETGWIATALADLAPGNRNDTFTKVVGRLHRERWQPEEIVTLLLPHADGVGFSHVELSSLVSGVCGRYSPAGNVSASPTLKAVTMETRRLEVVSLGALLASGPLTLSWSVQGVLPANGVGILAGPPGYGKSWMLLDLAIETALGGKWLGQFGVAQGSVLYIDEESGPDLLRFRLNNLLRARGVDPAAVDVGFCVGSGFSFSDPGMVAQLRARLGERRPRLVIIDSLIRVQQANENSASEMAVVFGVVKDLVREFGCAFLFADHLRKPGMGEPSADLAVRGSTEKAAFVDSLLTMKRKKDVGVVIEHAKSRFGGPVDAFVIAITDPQPGWSTVVRCVGDAAAMTREAQAKRVNPFLDDQLRGGGWVARKDMVEAGAKVGIGQKEIDAALKEKVEGGDVERENRRTETSRGKRAAFYRLVPGDGQETEEGDGTTDDPQGEPDDLSTLPGGEGAFVSDASTYVGAEAETSGDGGDQ